MRLLLAANLLLWSLRDPERLEPTVREMTEDRANEVRFSAASIWEIVVKAPGLAMAEPWRLYTADRLLAAYSDLVVVIA